MDQISKSTVLFFSMHINNIYTTIGILFQIRQLLIRLF